MIGGDAGPYVLDAEAGALLGRTANAHAEKTGASLLVSSSARTPEPAMAALRTSLGDVPVAIDTYRGSIRATCRAADAQAATQWRGRVEALGGAVSASSPHRDVDAHAAASAPRKASAELTARLEHVFDPSSVLWPQRA